MADQSEKTLGMEMFAAWMDAADLSQGAISRRTGITQSNISHHLRGRTPNLFAAFMYQALTGGKIRPEFWLTDSERRSVDKVQAEVAGIERKPGEELLSWAYALHDALVRLELDDVEWRRTRVGLAMAIADLEEKLARE